MAHHRSIEVRLGDVTGLIIAQAPGPSEDAPGSFLAARLPSPSQRSPCEGMTCLRSLLLSLLPLSSTGQGRGRISLARLWAVLVFAKKRVWKMASGSRRDPGHRSEALHPRMNLRSRPSGGRLVPALSRREPSRRARAGWKKGRGGAKRLLAISRAALKSEGHSTSASLARLVCLPRSLVSRIRLRIL